MLSILYDITVPISSSGVVDFGDPSLGDEITSPGECGNALGLKKIRMSNHMGTHVDFPAYAKRGGATSSDYGIDWFIRPGFVLDIPVGEKAIKTYMLKQKDVRRGDVVLLRTANSGLRPKSITESFVSLQPDAALYLCEQGVGMVGIDNMSIAGCRSNELPSHHILLGGGILILDGLNLSHVSEGRYKVFCFPLCIPNMDGLPARVILQRDIPSGGLL